MKVVCAWCGQVLSGPEDDGPVSHGICRGCAVRVQFHREPLREFLDRLAGPVLAVDGEGRVLGANTRALCMVQAGPDDVVGRFGGDVLSCVYASLPGGCGRTVHCSGCTVRRSFEHTMATGENLEAAEAFVYVDGPGGPEKKSLLVDTERVGDMVLVRMEGA